jgi:hypothetical protein
MSHSVDKRTILENYDLVALCIDEICDDGYCPGGIELTQYHSGDGCCKYLLEDYKGSYDGYNECQSRAF